MKTIKFNEMISAFCCDFVLSKYNKVKLSELDNMVNAGDKRLLEDIKLLEELDFLLRTGKAEIHIKELP